MFFIAVSSMPIQKKYSWKKNCKIITRLLTDPQVVTHLLWVAGVGGVAAGAPRDPAAAPPPHPPRGAARDLLLHHHRLAQLAAGEAGLLADAGVPHRTHHRLQTTRRRPQVGAATLLGQRVLPGDRFFSFVLLPRTECTKHECGLGTAIMLQSWNF